jgi:hypothetical protein
MTLDRTLPTQESLEVLMRADWEGELSHRTRCCELKESGAETSSEEQIGAHAAAVSAQIEALDDWLEDRCRLED